MPQHDLFTHTRIHTEMPSSVGMPDQKPKVAKIFLRVKKIYMSRVCTYICTIYSTLRIHRSAWNAKHTPLPRQ